MSGTILNPAAAWAGWQAAARDAYFTASADKPAASDIERDSDRLFGEVLDWLDACDEANLAYAPAQQELINACQEQLAQARAIFDQQSWGWLGGLNPS